MLMRAFLYVYENVYKALRALSVVILPWIYRDYRREREAGKMAIGKTLKVGDKVRYLGGDEDNLGGAGITEGSVCEVFNVDSDGEASITNDDGGSWYIGDWNSRCCELVTDEAEQPTKSTADLIANLALRVSELEAQSKRKEGDDMTVNGEYRAEKRHAKVGERIVVVAPMEGEDYERGDVFTVNTVSRVGDVIAESGEPICAHEYEVLPADMPQSERSLDGLLAQVTEENKHRADNADADNVDKPAHYTQGGVETIDYIAQVTGGYTDGFVAHCVGTTIKYVSRAPYKHESPAEDLRKARRYLDFAIERLEDER